MPILTTKNSQETKRLGAKIAKQVKRGGVICLTGDLGAGKTTFTQGLLKALKVKGPYTSPTFAIMKQYRIPATRNTQHATKNKGVFHVSCFMFHDVYHIDAYRIDAKDLLNLGWKEIIAEPKNIIIIEWADRVKKIIPKNSLWIELEWLDEKNRRITFR